MSGRRAIFDGHRQAKLTGYEQGHQGLDFEIFDDRETLIQAVQFTEGSYVIRDLQGKHGELGRLLTNGRGRWSFSMMGRRAEVLDFRLVKLWGPFKRHLVTVAGFRFNTFPEYAVWKADRECPLRSPFIGLSFALNNICSQDLARVRNSSELPVNGRWDRAPP